MPRLDVIPFGDEHLDAAAALLTERHRRHREAEPLLADADCAAELEAAWRADGAAGAAAVRDGRLVGYLVGSPEDDEVWGANAWVKPAGLAVEEAEIARDLYAFLAERWLEAGRNRHYVVVPAADPALVDAWSRLSFGQQQAFGIREVPDEPWPEGVRAAEPRDVDALLELAPLLSRHQALSPVFSSRPPRDNLDEMRADIEEDFRSEAIGTFVAEVDGRIVGNFVVAPVERSGMHSGLARPERACLLAWAATRPDARGSGAGLALTKACFAWAHGAGYPTMVTDWRVTNLLASRFWPRRGFRTSFLRLYRAIP